MKKKKRNDLLGILVAVVDINNLNKFQFERHLNRHSLTNFWEVYSK
jgi:hypothetical protein